MLAVGGPVGAAGRADERTRSRDSKRPQGGVIGRPLSLEVEDVVGRPLSPQVAQILQHHVQNKKKAQQQPVSAAPQPEETGKTSVELGMFEFSTDSREDPNEGLVFGDAPELCRCPHCERSVVSFIDTEASAVTWLLSVVVWFSLGWMALWLLPLLWPAFKDVVHRCPRCLNVIVRRSRISVPTCRSEVMTFKIGGCAVVLARKYVAFLLTLVGVIFAVYVFRSTVQLQPSPIRLSMRGPVSNITWSDFVADCGPRARSLPRHRGGGYTPTSLVAFEEKYRRRNFRWQGEVRRIQEGFETVLLRSRNAVYVGMRPPRYPSPPSLRTSADVVLLFGEESFKEVAALSPGQWVEFEATMMSHGLGEDPEVMSLFHVHDAPRPPELPSQEEATAELAKAVEEQLATRERLYAGRRRRFARPEDSERGDDGWHSKGDGFVGRLPSRGGKTKVHGERKPAPQATADAPTPKEEHADVATTPSSDGHT